MIEIPKLSLISTLNGFNSISLDEISEASLMTRIDTKFVIHERDLISVLSKVQEHYNILEINQKRKLAYATQYFDTSEKKFYNDHHNRKVNRTKVRMRKYVDTDICFLEIKQKNGRGTTTKLRTQISDFEYELSENSRQFIEESTQQSFKLSPSLSNKFYRITLVNKSSKERLTIDTDLHFSHNDKSKSYEKLTIIEVKQERFSRSSPFVKELKSMQVNPYKISKYCIGMISIHPHLKYNRFKKKLLKINKIAS